MTNSSNGPASEPKLDMLIKLLNMTTSQTDGEALVAIRKANDHIKKLGFSWEALLRGKVKIIADPFSGTPVPPSSAANPSSFTPHQRPQPTPQYTAPPRPQPQPQPSYQQQRTGGYPRSSSQPRPNQYAGTCAGCKTHVNVGAGMARRDLKDTKWEVWCTACANPGRRKQAAPSIDDILNQI